MKKAFKILLKITVITIAIVILAYFSFNAIVIYSTQNDIKDIELEEKFTCAIVLGAGVKSDGSPSHILRSRLDTAILLYNNGVVKKILMSGDHHKNGYDEVNTMKDYAIGQGVPSEDIFMDHAGLCTYDSMNRAKNIFCLDSAVIITQKFHMNRALYLAESFGIDAVGVPAINDDYHIITDVWNNSRESIARCKDFLFSIFKPDTTIMGDKIPITDESSGNVTNDK